MSKNTIITEVEEQTRTDSSIELSLDALAQVVGGRSARAASSDQVWDIVDADVNDSHAASTDQLWDIVDADVKDS